MFVAFPQAVGLTVAVNTVLVDDTSVVS
jgi:hypothetical protein